MTVDTEQEERRNCYSPVKKKEKEKSPNKDQMILGRVYSLNEETLYYNLDLNFCFLYYMSLHKSSPKPIQFIVQSRIL